jgi:hypothetical protein
MRNAELGRGESIRGGRKKDKEKRTKEKGKRLKVEGIRRKAHRARRSCEIRGFSCQLSAQPPAKSMAGLIKTVTYWESEISLKMLWERFPTAINSVEIPSKIVVGNHSHQELTLA